MSERTELLQDAIGMIKDEYIEEAHADNVDLPSANQAQTENKAANVVQIPQKRKHGRSARFFAVAASVVLALGVGALALTSVLNTSGMGDRDATTTMSLKSSDDTAMESDGYAPSGSKSGSAEMLNSKPGAHPGTDTGEAHVLTAGEWNDNNNWPFFMNLVNGGTIHFPVFGLDPTHRVKANVVDAAGNPVRGEEVTLRDVAGNELWRGTSDKEGAAYLFYKDGHTPGSVSVGGVTEPLVVEYRDPANQQGESTTQQIDDVTLTVSSGSTLNGLQVMFIVDTTGSMSDEIAYLQKDFASIASAIGSNNVEYSVNFYRDKGDEYVTKCNAFTSDVSYVQQLLNNEYADGGGDMPEAVADILDETITNNGSWRSDCNKIAFLIFDAPPHEGTDSTLEAAVRSAAAQGIRLVPVVASNADRDTELFGRALSIMTGASYVFLTDDSGVGDSHLEPIIGDYTVEPLHDVIVRIINNSR